MNSDEFIQSLKDLDIDVTTEKINKLKTYYEYLKEYNSHTNLTAIIEENDVYLKHFYDSLTLIKAYDLTKNITMLDVGSGAGFPGIVIKIFYPNIKLTVIDSNNKKTTFISSLVDKLGLQDVTVVNARAEDYALDHLNEFDLVTSRAVAFIDIITSISLPFVKLDGKLVLMKGTFDNEERVLKNHLDELNVKEYQIINFNLPNTMDERNLVILSKKEDTVKVLQFNQIIKRNKIWNNK